MASKAIVNVFWTSKGSTYWRGKRRISQTWRSRLSESSRWWTFLFCTLYTWKEPFWNWESIIDRALPFFFFFGQKDKWFDKPWWSRTFMSEGEKKRNLLFPSPLCWCIRKHSWKNVLSNMRNVLKVLQVQKVLKYLLSEYIDKTGIKESIQSSERKGRKGSAPQTSSITQSYNITKNIIINRGRQRHSPTNLNNLTEQLHFVQSMLRQNNSHRNENLLTHRQWIEMNLSSLSIVQVLTSYILPKNSRAEDRHSRAKKTMCFYHCLFAERMECRGTVLDSSSGNVIKWTILRGKIRRERDEMQISQVLDLFNTDSPTLE